MREGFSPKATLLVNSVHLCHNEREKRENTGNFISNWDFVDGKEARSDILVRGAGVGGSLVGIVGLARLV